MRVRITNGMFMALIINVIYAKAIGVTQSMMVGEAGSGIWLSTTFATLQGLVVMYVTVRAIRQAPERDMIDQAAHLLGSWAGKLLAVLFLVFFMGAYGGFMITFVYHLMDYFLPETPTYVFIMAALVVGVYGAYHGIEVMGRMAYVGITAIIALNILILIGSVFDLDIRNVMPVMEEGVLETLLASRHSDTDWAVATMMAAIVLPVVKRQETWGRSASAGLMFAWAFTVIWPILESGVLSAEVVKQYFVACMQLARSAHLGYFIQRYEMIMVAFFSISSLLQIMMGLFCAAHAVSKMFGRADYRPMLVPTGLLLGASGYWIVSDHTRAHMFLHEYWPWVALPIAAAVPFVMWGLGAALRNKKGKGDVKG